MARILESPGAVWCKKDVTAAGVLVDGNDYFKAFYDAALRARRSILLPGWQFDSDVALLRGKDAEQATLPVTLKAFLNALCERTPELHIHILAWDFHVVFALEREWMQTMVFQWTPHEHLQFRFDSSHVDKGCHHQKFAVIDGAVSFLGGLDLCDHRWDTRRHRDEDALRVSRDEPHKPFHDVQTYLVSHDVGAALEDLFVCRWKLAGTERSEAFPDLPPPPPRPPVDYREAPPRGAHVVPTEHVALSRTDPKGSPSKSPAEEHACSEVANLYVAAISAAERFVYVETQYFSSSKISDALVNRLRAPARSALDVVLVLNMRAETLKEEVAVGLAQAKVLADLRKAAEGTKHQLGIYYTVPESKDGKEPERATYIHAKLMIVDDRFPQHRLGESDESQHERRHRAERVVRSRTRRQRRRALEEHRAPAPRPRRRASRRDGPGADLRRPRVAALDDRARRRDGRLRLHPSPTERERKIIDVIDPQALPFDPHAIEDDEESRSIFARGIGALFRVFSDRDDRRLSHPPVLRADLADHASDAAEAGGAVPDDPRRSARDETSTSIALSGRRQCYSTPASVAPASVK